MYKTNKLKEININIDNKLNQQNQASKNNKKKTPSKTFKNIIKHINYIITHNYSAISIRRSPLLHCGQHQP